MGLGVEQSVYPTDRSEAKQGAHQAPQILADRAAKVEKLFALPCAPDGFGELFVFLELQLEKQPEANAWVGTGVPCPPTLAEALSGDGCNSEGEDVQLRQGAARACRQGSESTQGRVSWCHHRGEGEYLLATTRLQCPDRREGEEVRLPLRWNPM